MKYRKVISKVLGKFSPFYHCMVSPNLKTSKASV